MGLAQTHVHGMHATGLRPAQAREAWVYQRLVVRELRSVGCEAAQDSQEGDDRHEENMSHRETCDRCGGSGRIDPEGDAPPRLTPARYAEIRAGRDLYINQVLDEVDALRAELARVTAERDTLTLAIPIEDELAARIDEMIKHLATEQGFTYTGIARLLIDVQCRMAADWNEVGSLYIARNRAEAELLTQRSDLAQAIQELADERRMVKALRNMRDEGLEREEVLRQQRDAERTRAEQAEAQRDAMYDATIPDWRAAGHTHAILVSLAMCHKEDADTLDSLGNEQDFGPQLRERLRQGQQAEAECRTLRATLEETQLERDHLCRELNRAEADRDENARLCEQAKAQSDADMPLTGTIADDIAWLERYRHLGGANRGKGLACRKALRVIRHLGMATADRARIANPSSQEPS